MIDEQDTPTPAPSSGSAVPPPGPGPQTPIASGGPSNTDADRTVSTAPTTAPARDGEGTRDVIGDPEAPLTPTGDVKLTEHLNDGGDPPPEGDVTHRYGGTLQSEPTAEELPSDAKVTPLAEQVNPHAAQPVGAQPQPEEVNGAEQPEEGEKNVPLDAKDGEQFLSETSDQADDAARSSEDAQRDADRGRY